MEENNLLNALRSRLEKGAVLRQTAHDQNQYVVHLTTDPAISFPSEQEEQVNRVLHELNQI